MLKIDIIEEREEQLIGTDKDGNLVIVPNSPYYKLKREMDGRIMYKIDEKHQILETFDDRIFNIICNQHKFQSRPGISDELVAIINQHKKGEDDVINVFEHLIANILAEKVFAEVVDEYFKGVEGLVTVRKEGRIEHFLYKNAIYVDRRGACYQLGENNKPSYVCIVANGIHRTSGMYTVPTRKGLEKINGVTMEIIAKIAFLLSPNFKDIVFTDQLYPRTRSVLA